MDTRYLEAVVVGIITAFVAGFAGLGAHKPGSVATPSAVSAPVAQDLTRDL